MGSIDHWSRSIQCRVRQGLKSLSYPSVDTSFPSAFIGDVTPPVIRQWESRAAFDRDHMRNVAADLVRREVSRDIVLAGLLHDIGKPDRVSAGARTILVILNRLGPNAMKWLCHGTGTFPGRAHLRSLANHAETGAAFLQRHGASERVVWLVRYHHHERIDDEGLRQLQSADDRH